MTGMAHSRKRRAGGGELLRRRPAEGLRNCFDPREKRPGSDSISRYFNDDNISSHMSQSSISRNWRKMRLIQARNSSSSRAGRETGVVRQNWANEKLCWSTSVFNEAPSIGISRETDTALSFGNAAQ